MYVLVHHRVTDPDRFWPTAQNALPDLPPGLTLHHALSASDGDVATCLWEAESVEAVRDFLEPTLGEFSANTYARAENKEGIGVPSRYAVEPAS